MAITSRRTASEVAWTVVPAAVAVFVAAVVTHLDPQKGVKAVGGLLVLGLGLASMRYPRAAIFVALATMPIRFVTQALFGIQTELSELLTLLLLPALIKSARGSRPPWPVVVAFIALPLGSLLGLANSPDHEMDLYGCARWALAGVVALAVVGEVRRSPEFLEVVQRTLVVIGGLVGGFGFLQSKGIYLIFGPPYLPGHIDSTSGYYTVFAGFVAVTTVLGIDHLLRATSRFRILMLLFTSLSAIGLSVSLSRGGLASLGGGVAVLAFAAIRRPRRLFLFAGATAIGGSLASSAGTIGAFTARFNTSLGADSLRATTQSAGRTFLADAPLGYGYGGYGDLVINTSLVGGDGATAHAHELFIQIGLDTGWLGLASYALLVLMALQRAVRYEFSMPAINGLPHLAFAAALTGFLLQGFNDYLLYEWSAQVLAVLLPVLAFPILTARPSRDLRGRTDALTRPRSVSHAVAAG